MRVLLLGTAAIALSGCSWLGMGGHKNTGYSAHHNGGYYNHNTAKTSGCGTQNCLSRWNVEGAIGTAFPISGDIVNGDGLNEGADAVVNDISFNDAYKVGVRGELGGSYALSPNRKITANGFYQENKSDGRQDWGSIGGASLTGALSDYTSYGAEVGVRQYFIPTYSPVLKNLRPYVEGKVGGAYVEDINIEGARLGGANVLPNGADVPFLDGGWVPTAVGLVGVETPLFRHTTLGLETGLRYTGKLDQDNSVIGGLPIAGSNDGSGKWSVPVMLRGRYRF